jgi:E3 Ubiquitin ligase
LIVALAFILPIKPLTVSWFEVAAGIYFFSRGVNLLRQKRQNTTVSKIGNLLPGLRRVNGVAAGPDTISAPITGQPCYLYRTTVWQQRTAASQEWEKVAEETMHVPFFLNDSTGEVLIEPRCADLDLRSEFHRECDPLLLLGQNGVPESVSLFLTQHAITPARRIRIEECCIRPESFLFVAGTVAEHPGIAVMPLSRGPEDALEPGPSDTPEVIRLSLSSEPRASDGMTQQAKIAAALVKAGIQRLNAWDAAPVPCPEDSLRGNREARELLENGKREMQRPEPQSESHLGPVLVLMKGSAGSPFLISWRSRRELGRSHVWQSALLLCGGTVLSLAGLYSLLLTVGLR